MDKIRLGFVPAHRYPYDEDWAVEMRQRCISALKAVTGVEIIVPGVGLIHNGLVRDDTGAKATIDLFAQRDVQGVIIGTMTYGDEVSALQVAERLDVPVLAFGTKEGSFTPDGGRRSDAFCGTLAITSGLHRRHIPFSFLGIVWPEEEAFARGVETFARACAAVQGFVGARVGLVGQRTERSESGIIDEAALMRCFHQRVVPIPLPEVLATAAHWPDKEHHLLATLEEIKREAACGACREESLVKAAKLELTLQRYFQERELNAMAVSCWSDVPEQYGICTCSAQSRLTGRGMLAACEADVYGALTMLVQHRASLQATVPHLIDWTIGHQRAQDVFLAWHCGNAPVCLAADREQVVIREQAIMSQMVGPERSEGAIEFQLKPGIVTLSSLAECEGAFKMLITRGEIIPSEDHLRGSWAWVRVPDLSSLYRTLAEEGFAQHASMIHGDIADAVEAFCRFVDIEVVRV